MPTLDGAILKRQAGRFEEGRRILAHRLPSASPTPGVAPGFSCTWNERPSALFRTSDATNCADPGYVGRTIRGNMSTIPGEKAATVLPSGTLAGVPCRTGP